MTACVFNCIFKTKPMSTYEGQWEVYALVIFPPDPLKKNSDKVFLTGRANHIFIKWVAQAPGLTYLSLSGCHLAPGIQQEETWIQTTWTPYARFFFFFFNSRSRG